MGNCERFAEKIFLRLGDEIKTLLPDFGLVLAIDSKAINSLARGQSRKSLSLMDVAIPMLTLVRKPTKGKDKTAPCGEKVVSWFGYKLHLVVDDVYELPVSFSVTKASVSDVQEGHELIERLAEQQPEIIERCEILTADKGYDDTKLMMKLWDEYQVKPVIGIRNMGKNGEKTRFITGKDNIVYDYKGTVYCYCAETNRC